MALGRYFHGICPGRSALISIGVDVDIYFASAENRSLQRIGKAIDSYDYYL
jgi:hypothetical protein